MQVVEAFDERATGDEILQLPVSKLQVQRRPTKAPLEKLGKSLFFGDDPTRWLLVVSWRSFVLLERGKWSGKRSLRFNWKTLYNRTTRRSTFQLIRMLLSRDSLCPKSG